MCERQDFIHPPVIFLGDYDMHISENLVQGVDVWINTPRRPWEASGTSGMKVLVNGGLNLSELDGWWAEAYSPELGWALGDGKVTTRNKQLRFEVQVLFNGIDPNDVHVELFANGIDGKAPDIKKMKRGKKTAGTPDAFLFESSVPSVRAATDYTPRIIPYFPGVPVPLETNLILWMNIMKK